jgi:FdhD protein
LFSTSDRPANVVDVPVTEISGERVREKSDELATEEPMEIRVLRLVNGNLVKNNIAVTMRTPGNDFELAAGFLLSENVVRRKDDISTISYCNDPGEAQQYNIVNVRLSESIDFDISKLSRNVYTSSSCGICGKASLEQVKSACAKNPTGSFQVSPSTLFKLPETLRNSQHVFGRTGGLHAAALFDSHAKLLAVKEDVGRHNALDKLIGSLLLSDLLPAKNTILLVSGRASFELVQKAVIGGIPFLCAVGAPSSLALSLAKEYGMTLVGFLRGEGFNIYAGHERITS